MSDLPNLSPYGYQVSTELGRNREGGRITWKAVNLANQKTVVIKQFRFATTASSWSGYKAYQQEIEVLQKLEHSCIPRYLGSIETDDGFCLIQEYKKASKLSDYRQLTLVEIKKIILEILEILIYLQQHTPPILHRDIKPENILIDDFLNAYLIDFGFASFGNSEVAGSSVFKGTPGFIAPEQMLKPTMASDLYSLGVSIVCLLANKDISEIRDCSGADNPYQLNLKHLLPRLNRKFVDWLEKMTEPKVSKRFPNALEAKKALEPLDLAFNPGSNLVEMDVTKITSGVARTVILSTTALVILSAVAVLALNFADSRIEKTLVNIMIAIIAATVVTITELGAAAIALSDQEAKSQAIALAVIVPILLVSISGFILGMGEAVAIASGISVAEIVSLAYFLLKQSPYKEWSSQLKATSLLSAIGLGIALGLKSIL
jgi:serine/threonine protein kinase